MSSKSKSSFLLEEKYLNKLKAALDELITQINHTSKYQLANFYYLNSNITLYQSGIVIVERNNQIDSFLISFFKKLNLDIPPELKYKKKIFETSDSNIISQKVNNPSIWLSDKQLKLLHKHLETLPELVRLPIANKHELDRYSIGDDVFVINKNNTVFQTKGNYLYEILKKVIQDSPLFNQTIIGIESYGCYNPVGPVIVSCVMLNVDQSNELQSIGIKHSNSVRKISKTMTEVVLKEQPILVESQTILPHEYNKRFNTKNDQEFFKYLKVTVNKLITKQLIKGSQFKDNLNISNCLIILDPILDEICDIDSEFPELSKLIYEVYPEYSISNSFASIVNRLKFKEWKSSTIKNFKFDFDKKSLLEIMKNEAVNEIVKYKLFYN